MSLYSNQVVIEVIPSRINPGDVMAAEMLFGSLLNEDGFSLEVSGDDNGQHLLVRGPRETMAHVKNQIRAVYSHVEFREILPQEDPARPQGRSRVTAELKPEHSTMYPFRTFKEGDFETADPIRGLLGALKGLQPNERAGSQLILTPAPSDWARKYMPMAQPLPARTSSETLSCGKEVQHVLGFMWIMGTAFLGLGALFKFGAQDWLGFVVLAVITGLWFSGLGWGWFKLAYHAPIAPKMVEEKISRPAFQVGLRLYAYADTEARALELVQRLNGAYKQFGLANGNMLKGYRAQFDPQVLEISPATLFQEWRDQVMRLNVSELAALWHLPTGEAVKEIEHTMARRILPVRPKIFAEGILVGHAESQGERVPIHLSSKMLEHNTFMIAKTQKGKSTLMAHLAAAAMQKEMALIVIDPHGDLAREVSGRVPRDRLSAVRYLDWGDRQQAVGFNFLDVHQGIDENVIISNIVHAGAEIWNENWGPRMEDVLRHSLHVLLETNAKLAAQGQGQFTLLDVNALFRWKTFRQRLINAYVRNEDTIDWWRQTYDHLAENFRMEVILPVVTKLDRLAENVALKNIIGQSRSTLNFQEVLNERGIVLIDTASNRIGDDAAGLLTALFIDSLNYAIRAQTAVADARQRPRVMVIIDELQKLMGVNYGSFLAELQKMGASFVMGTQSLAQLEPTTEQAESSVLSNTDTLFVFDTFAGDAKTLAHNLDDVVDSTDIINLPAHTAYLKTQVDANRTQVVFVRLLPPVAADEIAQQQIHTQVARYSLPIIEAQRRRESFVAQWYGRDRRMRDKDDLGGDASSSQDLGGANAVGYDPKSPIHPKGPSRPPVPPPSTSETSTRPKREIKAPTGSKQSSDWGKP